MSICSAQTHFHIFHYPLMSNNISNQLFGHISLEHHHLVHLRRAHLQPENVKLVPQNNKTQPFLCRNVAQSFKIQHEHTRARKRYFTQRMIYHLGLLYIKIRCVQVCAVPWFNPKPWASEWAKKHLRFDVSVHVSQQNQWCMINENNIDLSVAWKDSIKAS